MKRLVSNAVALRRFLETGITIDSICEDMYCVESADVGRGLWADLQDRGYDRCGVRRDGRVIEYVERAMSDMDALTTLPIQIDALVAETTPLWDALPRLAEAGWLIVLTRSGPTSIVTVADLAKQPARLMMFGVVSLLEMTMLAIIRREYKADEWRSLLNGDRIRKAEDVLGGRRRTGQEIDLADCLQWCDKARICVRTERVMRHWEFSSKCKGDRLFKDLQVLRDHLAHAQHPAPHGNWQEVAEWLYEADRLIDLNMKLLGTPSEPSV